MDKEKIKNTKLLYYPYKITKKIIHGIAYYVHYINSLYHINKNKKRVQEKIDNNEVLNVVFVVQYIPGWNKLEPVYRKMKSDRRFNPTIVCVPLNIQNHKLIDDKGNDTYEYFKEHGYNAIDALKEDGGWYDLHQLKPDYLFHSRPYNHFMPEPYTSGKIVKYALICNIMYGLSTTTTILPVTINKNYFMDVFCYFSADESESNFYKKRFALGFMLGIVCCYPYGAISLEYILNARAEERYVGFRKTIMWTPRWSTDHTVGGSNFFNYKDIIIRLAKENSDILFIIRPHPLMFDNFISTGEMSEREVEEFKVYCQNQKNIMLDEKKEYTETFWKSDALITDFSSIIPEYFVTGKPIIYCHSNIDYHYLDAPDAIIRSSYEVHNSEELKNAFNIITGGSDVKHEQRKTVFNTYYNEVNRNSDNIIKICLRYKF